VDFAPGAPETEALAEFSTRSLSTVGKLLGVSVVASRDLSEFPANVRRPLESNHGDCCSAIARANSIDAHVST